MTCDRCGMKLEIGMWAWCPHGRGVSHTVPDDVPGGFVVENGFDEPTRFYSHSEHRAALAARGLEIRAKWSGPNDRHLSRMDIPCATTLENARILLTRGVKTEPVDEPSPITVTNIRFERPA